MDQETRREKFKRLAEKRTKSVLEKIRILSNLFNKSVYDYEDQDIKRIFNAIEEELRIAKTKTKIPQKRDFKL